MVSSGYLRRMSRVFLRVQHATARSGSVQDAELNVSTARNDEAELVFRKGLEHEAAYLAWLRTGKSVAQISLEPELDWDRAGRETVSAEPAWHRQLCF